MPPPTIKALMKVPTIAKSKMLPMLVKKLPGITKKF